MYFFIQIDFLGIKMKKNIFKILVLFLLCLFISKDYLMLKTSNYSNFYSMPVLYEGRVKPLGIIAEFNFKRLFKNKEVSMSQLMFNSENFLSNFYFKINDLNLVQNIGLAEKTYFNFFEIFDAIKKNKQMINNLIKTDSKHLLSSQIEFLKIYQDVLVMLNIRSIFELILFDKIINEKFDGKITSKYELICKFEQLDFLNDYLTNDYLNIKIIPLSDTTWLNLAEYIKVLNFKDNSILKKIITSCKFFEQEEYKLWNLELADLKTDLKNKLSAKSNIFLEIEIFYSKIDFLTNSILFFLICVLSFIIKFKCINFDFRLFFFKFGSFLLFFEIFFRIILTEKAPVTSLYDSIIFVNFFFSVLFIFLLNKNKNDLYFFSAFLPIILNIVALNLSVDNNIKNLTAVLNTNFWLTIHVITISVGYGLCVIAGFFSHVYLCLKINHDFFLKHNKKIYNYIFSFSVIALFFSFIGTLLGGIWADQSWGRFWGWDPKENGALLIVLWLTLFLHAKISNIISEDVFVIGIILNLIMLSLAWFGINLLNIGLHSYGFIEHIEIGLLFFITFELCYIIFFYCYFKLKYYFSI